MPKEHGPHHREEATNVVADGEAARDDGASPESSGAASPTSDDGASSSGDGGDSPPGAVGRGEGRRQILRDAGKGLLFAGLILLIQIVIEHTPIGHGLESAGYDILQGRLTFDKVPVQVIDISDLKQKTVIINGKPYTATPREELREIIAAVVEQQPRAVGVDIDFAPDDDGFITPRDPDFFRFCASQKVPVFLGVYRTLALPPEAWLGGGEFEPLAAGIILPNESRRVPKWIQTSEHYERRPTLSGALGGAFGETRCEGAEWLTRAGLAEQVSERGFATGGGAGEIAVDYSPLEKLVEDRTLHTSNPAVIRDQGRLLSDKIVIIGDAGAPHGRDSCRAPGREAAVAGVYCHACAAYTLSQAPLYELTARGRVVLDLLLSAAILLTLTTIRLVSLRGGRADLAVERVHLALTLLVVAAAIVFGVLFVRRTCVMWSDFMLALGFLVMHPSVEHKLEHFLHQFAHAARSFWNALAHRRG